MSRARTIWEEGRESGRHVVALGAAVALTVTFIDLLIDERLGVLFDLTFAVLSLALAFLVQPKDFFVVGVLPPLIMLGIFALLALTQPEAIANRSDGFVQAVVSGLGHHCISLFVGYALCLACLGMRRRVLRAREESFAAALEEHHSMAS